MLNADCVFMAGSLVLVHLFMSMPGRKIILGSFYSNYRVQVNPEPDNPDFESCGASHFLTIPMMLQHFQWLRLPKIIAFQRSFKTKRRLPRIVTKSGVFEKPCTLVIGVWHSVAVSESDTCLNDWWLYLCRQGRGQSAQEISSGVETFNGNNAVQNSRK